MSRTLSLLAPLCLVLPIFSFLKADGPSKAADRIAIGPADWPWWRGPTRDGIAAAGQKPPVRWGEKENVLWRSPVPGRGHGAPVVVGDRVFLATAETDAQMLVCFDRRTGAEVWRTVVHRGGVETKGNAKSSNASATPACDGTRVFINFLNAGAVYTSALGLDGKLLWQVKVTDFVVHQGFGSSPTVYGPLVIVSADNKGTGLIAGLDRATGATVWTRRRPKLPNYTSPVVLTAAGRAQLVLSGCDLVTALAPLTGEVLWEAPGATTECVTSAVTDGALVFTSGGYPKNHVSAVRADGSGRVGWENKSRVYVPSMLVAGGHLYAVLDEGVPVCWKADTGAEVWRGRLGGTFSRVPGPGRRAHLRHERGGEDDHLQGHPGRVRGDRREQARGRGDGDPGDLRGRIFMRVAVKMNGRREEYLYCLGAKE